MNPLMSAQAPIASNRELVGTAAGPAHRRINAPAEQDEHGHASQIECDRPFHGEREGATYPAVVMAGVSLGIGRPERREDQRLQQRGQSHQPPGNAVGRDLGRAKIVADHKIVGAEHDHRGHLNQEKRRAGAEQFLARATVDERRPGQQPRLGPWSR